MLQADPELELPEHALLRDSILRRFGAIDTEPIAA